MDAFLSNVGPFAGAIVVLVLALIALAVLRPRWKSAKADEVLVVSGGRNGLKIYVSGGAFVWLFRKVAYFPLGMMTVSSSDQETQTNTLVPVVVKWTAQIRPDTDTPGGLQKAIVGFSGQGNKENNDHIKTPLQETLEGEVRMVVATLSPEEVVTDKEKFYTKVRAGVADQMKDLGFTLVSLNIAEVSDKNDYYKNAAAKNRESMRQEAETVTAEANREVAVAVAAASQVAESAKLEQELTVAGKTRDVEVQKASYKVEVDRAQKDAEFSGQLQEADRAKDLATRKGQVKVVEVEQEQLATKARQQVELTDADTARQKLAIEAEAASKKLEIDTAAAAKKRQIDAEAEASASIETSRGKAEARNLETEAEARNQREVGIAKADARKAEGDAEAAATLAMGEAKAKAALLEADALAAREGANLSIRLAEIQRDTTVTIYTELGKSMSTIGERATFIDMSGSASRGEGDLLSGVMGNIPKLLKSLNVENMALNGAPLGASIGALLAEAKGKSVPSAASSIAKVDPVAASAPQEAAVPEAPAEDATPAEAAASAATSASDIVNDLASEFPQVERKGRNKRPSQQNGE